MTTCRTILLLSCFYYWGHTSALPCSVDSQCGSAGVCLKIEVGNGETLGQCTAASPGRPPCRGRVAGHCPTLGKGFERLICAFQETTKLRDVKCCNVAALAKEVVPGSTTTAPVGSLSRNLQVVSSTTTTADDDNCFECFTAPSDDSKVGKLMVDIWMI